MTKIIAKAIIINPDGEILILRRSKTHPKYAFHPDFPGGEVEPGEDPLKAVTREIHEEAGLIIDPRLVKLVYKKTPNQEFKHLVYETRITKNRPKITISWEHDEYSWQKPTEIIEKYDINETDTYYSTVIEYIKTMRL